MPTVLQSRKLWAAVVGLIFILVNAWLNKTQIDPDTVTNAIMGIVAAYMASVAWEDGQKAKAPTTTVTTPAANVTLQASDAPPTAGDPVPPYTITSTGLH